MKWKDDFKIFSIFTNMISQSLQIPIPLIENKDRLSWALSVSVAYDHGKLFFYFLTEQSETVKR